MQYSNHNSVDAKLKPVVAICYDFDKTLSPKDMQEYALFDKLGISADEFWQLSNNYAQANGMDMILSYMKLVVDLAHRNPCSTLTRRDFVDMGRMVELFGGVESWFGNINEFVANVGLNVEHYIISSGQKEIIEGTSIAKYFKAIYASSFVYDQHSRPVWPNRVVNSTQKTQYLYRINKNCLDMSDEMSVHRHMPHQERRIPFENIIYIGDSFSDIPAMSIVAERGGHSIGVYNDSTTNTDIVRELLQQQRINFFAPTSYATDSTLYLLVTNIINKISINQDLMHITKQQRDSV
ncbi:MAG: haloacid dehalogenase-like hydrolase [Clostridiales bacterium]|jgi:2-hydroxy-3-keto-5-methylthiopentenyl-1-phosphate phosphatase|nr:haloacid dehalogenase-like hydrolase [Clostridiales bacterium]